jgi:LacI family transcriptional regulator, galactose operon repressor
MSPSRRPAGAARGIATIGDVARVAGVSPATVSRVLNGTSRVAADKAERVRRAAEQLDYQPFGPAQALRQQRTRLWTVIIADIENPFFTAMVRGVEDIAVANGYRVVLCNSDEDPTKEAAYVDMAVAERSAGVIIAVASTKDSRLEPLLDQRIPVVAVDRQPLRAGIDSVLVDNRLGAEEAIDHLIATGHRRIACITGPTRVSTANERLAGYKQSFSRHGLAVDQALIRRTNFKQDGGHRAARSLLKDRRKPDALFVANNLMTLGALEAVREVGLDIPGQISLVGFDDAPWTGLTDPPLTVVAQPNYDMGRRAAELLLSSHDEGAASRHIVLAPTLLVRQSTRAGGPTDS